LKERQFVTEWKGKKSMARKSRKSVDSGSNEQMELIEVGPENLRDIKPIARRYKAAMEARMEALAEESEAKQQILAMVKEAKLSRLQDGTIRFRCDGMVITVTPRDELVKVKEENAEQEGD